MFNILIPFDEETVYLKKDMRFLIGHNGSTGLPAAFKLTRIDRVCNTYDLTEDDLVGQGILKLVVSEDYYRPDKDNAELGLCDYFEPEEIEPSEPDEEPDVSEENEGGWF